jgi:hypothetical protein
MQGLLGECDLLQQGALREVLAGDFRNERDLHAEAGGITCEVAFKRGLVQAADAAEEIELVRDEADENVVVPGLDRRPPGDGRARCPPSRAGGGQIDGREERATGDAVLGARMLHVQRGDAEVAVVFQCGADELPEARIGEEGSPVERGGGGAAAIAGKADGHHFDVRLVERRHEGAGSEECCGEQDETGRFHG